MVMRQQPERNHIPLQAGEARLIIGLGIPWGWQEVSEEQGAGDAEGGFCDPYPHPILCQCRSDPTIGLL